MGVGVAVPCGVGVPVGGGGSPGVPPPTPPHAAMIAAVIASVALRAAKPRDLVDGKGIRFPTISPSSNED